MSSKQTPTELPEGITSEIDVETGKTFYKNHITKTTTFVHPRHTENHEPFTPDLPYPYERGSDDKGRAFYTNHETKETSWMNPVKLAALKATGILDVETDEYSGDNEDAWKAWVLESTADAPNQGEVYWVNYRTGIVEWQSPEDKLIGKRAAEARRAAAKADSSKNAS